MKKTISILFFILTTCLLYSQEKKNKLADKKYNELAYMDAIKIYEKLVQDGKGNSHIFRSLANSYYFNANYIEANKWFEKLFENSEESNPESYYRYSQTLKSAGNPEKSNIYFKKFSDLDKNDKRSLFYKENSNYLADISKISNRFQIENASINTEFIDYGGTFFNNNFIYTSSKADDLIKDNNKWTNQPYTNLYKSAVVDGKFTISENFDKKINTKFNESNAVFSNDGLTMYFSKNNFNNGKKGKNDSGLILIKIYRANFLNNEWTNVTELSFNNDDYNCAHPTLSNDGKFLYFSSDMPGGFGRSDLYKIEINADGTFKTPINLGDKINTAEKETFPFIATNNELYFSSDGHLGLGGLDVFATKISENGQINKIINAGAPVNSSFDDFGYVKDKFSNRGAVSSNRPGGKGFDDIYTFVEEVKLPLDCKQTVTGTVKDNADNYPVKNASVILFDEQMKEISTRTSDENGAFEFSDLDCSTTYFIRANAEKYLANEIQMKTTDIKELTQVTILLTKRFIEIKKDVDLAKEFDIANINFVFNDWHITPFAEQNMFVLLTILQKYPSIKIKIGSHTDTRGSNQFNLKLSKQRASETKKWLVNNGIASARIIKQGFGESKIINQCTEGAICSEKEHLINRRSEFIIVKE